MDTSGRNPPPPLPDVDRLLGRHPTDRIEHVRAVLIRAEPRATDATRRRQIRAFVALLDRELARRRQAAPASALPTSGRSCWAFGSVRDGRITLALI